MLPSLEHHNMNSIKVVSEWRDQKALVIYTSMQGTASCPASGLPVCPHGGPGPAQQTVPRPGPAASGFLPTYDIVGLTYDIV